MTDPDDELFKVEGPSTSVKLETGGTKNLSVKADSSGADIEEPSDISASDESPKLMAVMPDLGLDGDTEEALSDKGPPLADLFEERIAKVRRATADIDRQLLLISPPPGR